MGRTGLVFAMAAGLVLSDSIQPAISARDITPVSCSSSLIEMLDENTRDFLYQRFDGFSRDEVPLNSFEIVTLSNLAEGVANINVTCENTREDAKRALEKIVEVALDPRISVYRKAIDEIENLGTHGLYLAHLNIILGKYEQVNRNGRFADLNRKISEHLASGSLADSRKHFRSYSGKPFKWPADQAALLYSLHLFDRNFGAELSAEPIREWIDYMKRHATDRKTGLPFSEVSGLSSYGRIPRGCALSWTIKYMAKFAPEEARGLWIKYKDGFYKDGFFVSGFREWPEGVDRGSDIDSGPIIAGIGTAATAFGIGAARAVGDGETYLGLKRTERAGEAYVDLFGNEETRSVTNNLLTSAIRLSSDTTPRLYNP